jgi:hypothetical protein
MAFITTAALIGAGASLIGGAMQSSAASKAAKTQAKSADAATALQREMYEKNLELQKPFYEAGLTGQNALMQYLGLGGDPNAPGYGAGMKPFTGADLANEPGYQFRLGEGINALNRTAAARGGMMSGRALKEAERYGQDYASNEYNNAFNRYYTQRNQMLNPLQSLLGQAQTSAGNVGAAGQNYATQAGSNMMQAANARASGYMGGANALSSALSGAATPYMNYNMMSSFMPQGGSDLTSNYAAAGYPLPPVRPY